MRNPRVLAALVLDSNARTLTAEFKERWTVKKSGRKRLASERLVTGKRQVHRICRTPVTRTLVAD